METDKTICKILNHSECFFEYETGHTKVYIEYMIALVYSGELLIKQGNKTISVKKGECVFFKYDWVITLLKKKYNKELFRGAFLGISKTLLYEFYKNYNKSEIPIQAEDFKTNIIKLPKSPYIQSLYISFIPYFQWEIKPTEDIIRLKQQEGIYSLLLSDPRFYSSLFSFIQS